MGPIRGLRRSFIKFLLEDLERIRAATRKKGRAGMPGIINPINPSRRNTPTTVYISNFFIIR